MSDFEDQFPPVPSPTLESENLYLAEPARFLIWLHTSLFWITIKSFLLSFDTPQESLLLSRPPHVLHLFLLILTCLGLELPPPLSLILTLPRPLFLVSSRFGTGLAVLSCWKPSLGLGQTMPILENQSQPKHLVWLLPWDPVSWPVFPLLGNYFIAPMICGGWQGIFSSWSDCSSSGKLVR